MNRTQKSAFLSLVIGLITIGFMAVVLIDIFSDGQPSITVAKFLPIVLLITVITGLYWLNKKQSPKEVAEDERDRIIKYKAAVSALVCLLVMLGIATMAVQFIIGTDSEVPVVVVTFINVFAGLAAMFAYTLATLVQFHSNRKNGKDELSQGD